MVKRVSASHAKAQLPALVAEVAFGGKRVIIERRGRPMAALVRVDELERLEDGRATSARPRGALALVGAWRELKDEEVESLVADIYAERESDNGRLVTS